MYSHDTLNYIYIPNNSNGDNIIISNTNQNPTTLNYIYAYNNNNGDKNTFVSDTNQNTTTEISSIKREQVPDFVEYKIIGRSAKQRRINVVLIGERINPQLKILVLQVNMEMKNMVA